jgi:hypothetical protein
MALNLAVKARAIKEIVELSLRYPQLTRELVGQLPAMVRGRKYGMSWPTAQTTADAICTDDTPNPLQEFFDSHTEGRGVWKWMHYFDIYHRHLQKFIGKEVHVLEVGVYSGGSLEMWRQYFGSQCHLYGVDIRDECKTLENDRTRIFIGDQADRGFWSQVRRDVPNLDVLIDDGGHLPEQQIVTLEETLPHLRRGGLYVCEDATGDGNRFSAFVRALGANLDSCDLVLGHGKELSSPVTKLQSDIHSIHSYPYVTVVEKRPSPLPRLVCPAHGTEWRWQIGRERTHSDNA